MMMSLTKENDLSRILCLKKFLQLRKAECKGDKLKVVRLVCSIINGMFYRVHGIVTKWEDVNNIDIF